MNVRRYAALLLVLVACRGAPASVAPRAHSGPIRRVVLVTVDGLLPESYLNADARGLKVPTLRRFLREGAHGAGTQGVFPTVTYPSHTTIATGVLPGKHGIVNNRPFDPLQQNAEGWYWYAQDIAAPTLWDAARQAGLHTALISWPVSVGAQVDFLVPEYWRARQPDDLKLLRALSTPGLLDSAQRAVPDLEARLLPPTDSAIVDIASHVIGSARPELVLLHIFQVDEAQHRHGLWSAEAVLANENADAQLARLFESVERAGIAAETALVIASDHGFANVARQVHPGALLREAGLITLDDKGKPSAYRASYAVGGALTYVYVREGEDAGVEGSARALFEARVGKPGSGIARVYGRDEIRARGGDARAAFALEAEPGVYFGWSLGSYESPPGVVGMHGYDPERPEMQASLLWLGPGVQPGARTGTRLVDIAPTIASWLSLDLPNVDGRVLR